MPKPTTRFILLSMGRTGTTLLWTALEQHPDVLMYGEVFHTDVKVRYDHFPNGPGIFSAYKDGHDAREYLEREVFGEHLDRPAVAQGCKIFYEHARNDVQAKRAWEYLIADEDVRVIHLTRDNLLDCFVSLTVARKTGEWVLFREGAPTTIKPFAVSPDSCEVYFDNMECLRTWANRAFAKHPLLHLEYERDLTANFERTMSRTCEFLGVRQFDFQMYTRRQRLVPTIEQLTNYDELREYFRFSPHERFFQQI